MKKSEPSVEQRAVTVTGPSKGLSRLRRRGSPWALLTLLSMLAQSVVPLTALAAPSAQVDPSVAAAAIGSPKAVDVAAAAGASAKGTNPAGAARLPSLTGTGTASTPVAAGTSTQYLAVAPGAAGDKTGASSQAISVPKGAGTIEGMGESFSAQLSTGIATFSVPIALPPARGGAQASLGLSYSSGSGWGIAGVGWDVGVPFIARQSDRGTPHYGDQADFFANQDRFVFNGGQELVPICTVGTAPQLECAGKLADEQMPAWSAGAQYFRPRVEGSFLRFFWESSHDTWRVQDKSGVTMELGVALDGRGDRSSLEVNPTRSDEIFRWNLVRQYDTQGDANPASGAPAPNNVVVYRYRTDGNASLLSDIYDTPPAATPTTQDLKRFAHHAHLEYEARTDPVTSYRSGWSVRRGLRLARIDVTSKSFNSGDVTLRQQLRRYHLTYASAYHESLLASVQVEGRCVADESATQPSEDLMGALPAATNCPRLPAMSFEYSHVAPFSTSGAASKFDLAGYEPFDERVHDIGNTPPHSVDEEQADFFDMNGDALPDLLVTMPGVYGGGFGQFINAPHGTADSFSGASNVPVSGVLGADAGTLKLSNPNVAVLDLDGDARVDLVHMPLYKTYAVYSVASTGISGHAVTTASQQSPKLDLGRDAFATRVFDVDGDGLVDVVLSTGTELQTFFSLGRFPGARDQFGHATRAGATTSDVSNDPVRTCLPHSATAVDFGNREIQLGDLNGDGLQDIVKLQRGAIRYWPGRGNGYFGTGDRASCAAGTFGSDSDVLMQNSPQYSDIEGTSLRVDDVNGDGLDDLVQVRTDAVDVWLNVDGAGWTERHIIGGTPASPSFANRVRLVDINGSGTRDILWADSRGYQYIDLQGGKRPHLLSRVVNGLGKTTDIEYSTSTEEMLAADRANGSSTWSSPWTSRMPIVAQVVKRTTDSDNLYAGGTGPNQIVTEYSYRDPVYDGHQREFRGFTRGRSRRVGDTNSPSDITESQFLLGECRNGTVDAVGECSDPALDNPREALKGLPVASEHYDEAGLVLSTERVGYRLRRLYSGRDGRYVHHAFESQRYQTSYDTFAGPPTTRPTGAMDLVELEIGQQSGFDPFAQPTGDPPGLVRENVTVPLPSESGTATTRSRSHVDYFGNKLVSVASGCVAGSACGGTRVGVDANEALFAFTRPGRPAGDTTGWLFRTTESWVHGELGAHAADRKHTITSFDSRGNPTTTQAVLSGTVALERRHRTLSASSAVAPAPVGASADGLITLSTLQYDQFGNRTREQGPNGHCHSLGYDALTTVQGVQVGYAQFVTSETLYTAGCDGVGLTSGAAYDRGLGKPMVVTDATGQDTRVSYDEFGRLATLRRPSSGVAANPPRTSLSVSYSLATPSRPYSTIQTVTQDAATSAGAETQWSVAFVDGMGRTRLTRTEADPLQGRDAGSAIEGGVATYDAKGAVARGYQPVFVNAQPSDPLPRGAPATPYVATTYDAFGRAQDAFHVGPGEPVLRTAHTNYHALCQDVWDAADLGETGGPEYDSTQSHAGTYATSCVDGHGRGTCTTERVAEGNAMSLRDVCTRYLPSGEPEAITRVLQGSGSTPPVVRWMRYDTLGRLVLNVDPHTTGNFTDNLSADATVSPSGLHAWRYAYNDAGDLVGTSDARGCGVNYLYDGAGRLLVEDYSPCEAAHVPYSPPDLASYQGLEVFYQYDHVPTALSELVGAPPSYDGNSLNLNGRLAAVFDRAGVQYFTYDTRGRQTRFERRLAEPNPQSINPATRFRGRWFATTTSYDSADRAVRMSTGAISAEFLDSEGKSEIASEYSGRGTLRRVAGSYGELISSIKRAADGQVEEVIYGDAASTALSQEYNSRRWLKASHVTRAVPALWSTPPAAYLPPPNLSPLLPSSFQMILRDDAYRYDVVGNPTAITDYRQPADWPAGAKPVSRSIIYDDLYRVTQVSYTYSGGPDTYTSPFAFEEGGGTHPRQSSNPARRLVLPYRVASQSYSYDWLGSITKADDDAHAMWDRGVGSVTSFAANGRPYQWKSAGHSADPNWAGTGSAEALPYDEMGNLLGVELSRTGVCAGAQ
ncbi:MAG: toxin TcdB middle/N-terminal domain-containing protein [Polyangiaceae bacterium]